MDILRRVLIECTAVINALRSPRWPNGLMPALYSGIDLGGNPLWSPDEDPLANGFFLATPKKRRSLERRRIRKFLPFTMDKYKPRDDLVPCPNCGYLHPSGFLCVNCYNKVREETNALRSLIGDRLPSDSSVYFHYENDPANATISTARTVQVERSRPSWFPAILLRPIGSSGKDET